VKITEFFDIATLFEAEESHEFTYGNAAVKVVDQGSRFLITGLESKNRGSGDAKAVMKQAVAFVADQDKPVELHAIPDDDTDTKRLIQFYQSFGFKRTGKPWNHMAMDT
jgi:predicted GNAT family N-acyltransferase